MNAQDTFLSKRISLNDSTNTMHKLNQQRSYCKRTKIHYQKKHIKNKSSGVPQRVGNFVRSYRQDVEDQEIKGFDEDEENYGYFFCSEQFQKPAIFEESECKKICSFLNKSIKNQQNKPKATKNKADFQKIMRKQSFCNLRYSLLNYGFACKRQLEISERNNNSGQNELQEIDIQQQLLSKRQKCQKKEQTIEDNNQKIEKEKSIEHQNFEKIPQIMLKVQKKRLHLTRKNLSLQLPSTQDKTNNFKLPSIKQLKHVRENYIKVNLFTNRLNKTNRKVQPNTAYSKQQVYSKIDMSSDDYDANVLGWKAMKKKFLQKLTKRQKDLILRC